MIVKKGNGWQIIINTSGIFKGQRKNTDLHKDVHEVSIVGEQWWPLYGFHAAHLGRVPKVYDPQGKETWFGDAAYFKLENTRLLWPVRGTESDVRIETDTYRNLEHVKWLQTIEYDYEYQQVAEEWSLPAKSNVLSMSVAHPWLHATAVCGQALLNQFSIVRQLGVTARSDILFIQATHHVLLETKGDAYYIARRQYPLQREYFIRAYNLFDSGGGFHIASRLPHLGTAEKLSFLWRDSGRQWQLGGDTDMSGI